MRSKFLIAEPFVLVYVNDLDAFVPEIWAMESIMILEENINYGVPVQ